jgi:hypothetical protein
LAPRVQRILQQALAVRDRYQAGRMSSVLRTLHQRQLDAGVILPQLLRSRQPMVALAPPPAVQ